MASVRSRQGFLTQRERVELDGLVRDLRDAAGDETNNGRFVVLLNQREALEKLLRGRDTMPTTSCVACVRSGHADTGVSCYGPVGVLDCTVTMLRAELDAAKKKIAESDAVRIEVRQFGKLMERKLAANEHKGGWDDEEPEWLLRRLREETKELAALIRDVAAISPAAVQGEVVAKIGREAADVANFAMMIADRFDALPAPAHGRHSEHELPAPSFCPKCGVKILVPAAVSPDYEDEDSE
jgi:NTP pyrophosphatase (non-canonical NTP hydrolase)